MRRLIGVLFGLAVLGCTREKALAWAREGHEVVAFIAERLISPITQAKVNELLAEGSDRDLVSVACWADELVLAARGEGPLDGNAEAQEFNRKFPYNRTWHFINLPLGTVSFEEGRKFMSADDIVQAISRCIQVLESPGESQEFSRVQALRLLVHFVGDVHQPLHCGTGYYGRDGPGAVQIITYPEEAFGKPNDRGGNLLFFGTNATEQLHALWDAVIVEKIDDMSASEALADFLFQNYAPEEIRNTAGDYHVWAQAWAVESVRIATLAYLGIAFEKAEFGADKSLIRIEIKLPTNYLRANKAYAAQQLTKAGARLAQLLDRIKWPSRAKP